MPWTRRIDLMTLCVVLAGGTTGCQQPSPATDASAVAPDGSTASPAVDPVSVKLLHISDKGERDMGMLVSREGALDIDGLVPGTYRLRARAAGYVPRELPVFEVVEGRVTRLPPIELVALASIEFKTILDENNRPLGGDRGIIILEVVPKDQPARRILSPTMPVEMPPGPVTIRARVEEAGLAYEESFDLKGGTMTTVVVRMRKTN